jgi:hypothetical protein
MTIQAHLATLEKKHGDLEQELHSARQSPSTDDQQIADLKRKKLRIKDKIEKLKSQTTH